MILRSISWSGGLQPIGSRPPRMLLGKQLFAQCGCLGDTFRKLLKDVESCFKTMWFSNFGAHPCKRKNLGWNWPGWPTLTTTGPFKEKIDNAKGSHMLWWHWKKRHPQSSILACHPSSCVDLLVLVKRFSDLKRTHPKCILAVETLAMWPKMSCPFQKGDQSFGSMMLQKWKCLETTGSRSTKIGYVNGGVTKASMGDC